jgi:hypothetical protein
MFVNFKVFKSTNDLRDRVNGVLVCPSEGEKEPNWVNAKVGYSRQRFSETLFAFKGQSNRKVGKEEPLSTLKNSQN